MQHLAAGSTSASTVLMQLGLVLLTLGLLAHRIGLSPIPLYLVAGLTVGEHGAVPVVTGQAGRDFIEIGAEIGAVLLLLMLGLEYAADELVVALRRNAPAGLVDLVLNATPGAALALLLGWGPVAAVALAGITWVSSSGIVTKLLDDLGQLGNRETPVIIAVLVFEDLAMAAYLPVIGALLSGLGVYAATASVAAALAAVAVVFVVALRFPGLLARLVFAPNDEVLLLRVLGLAFFVAGMTAQLDVSATVGAFLVGVSLSGPVAEAAVELLRPLRDLFAAVFFVFFGLQIDPAQLPTALPLAVGLALLTAFTKIATGWWAAQRAGIARPGRLRVGVALIARGEFSIVIAGITSTAAAAGAVDLPVAFLPLAASYVLLLAIAGPVVARLVAPGEGHRHPAATGGRRPVPSAAHGEPVLAGDPADAAGASSRRST